MQKSKIYEVLRGLSTETNRELQKWLAAKNYPLREDVAALFAYFQKNMDWFQKNAYHFEKNAANEVLWQK